MKNLLLLSFLALTIGFAPSCEKEKVIEKEEEKKEEEKKEEKPANAVEEKNMGLVFKFTGTNCYYCGDWGWPFFKEMITLYHKKDAVCIGAYSQNQFAQLLISPIATAFDKRVPVTKGYPTFTGNFVDAWSGGNTLAGMKNVISTEISNHKSSEVIVNAGFTSTIEDDYMTVSTSTKFFKDTEGEYYIGVYMLENGVVANQSGPNGGPNAVHDCVLRSGNGDFGELISEGEVKSGKFIDRTIKLQINPSWKKENLNVFTIIWKKNGDKYDFVNAYIKS
jgi:hypothetical protein